MKKTITVFTLLCFSVALLFCFVGCKDKDTTVIRVNEVTHSIFYAPFYAAINLGYFEEEGLTVELTNGGGSDKSMTALLTGDADIALLGPETAVYVANEGKENYAVVFAQLTKKDGSFLLGKTPDDDFSWDKLKGKSVIGGRTGGMPEMMLEYVLKLNGLEPNVDLTVRTDVTFDLMGGAFIGGDDDYVTMFEPSASTMELADQGYIVASVGEAGGDVPFTCFVTMKDKMENDSELIEKFTKVIYKAQQWIERSSIDEIAEALLPSFADSDKELIKAVVKNYKEIDVWKSTPVMLQEDYERLIDVITEAGIITSAPDFKKIIDNSIAEKVSSAK